MRDNFTDETKRNIAARVGHRCSNPDCQALTSGPQIDPAKSLNVGVAAHISAASNGGPRFNSTLEPDDRRSAENAIWLCQNCAKLVDNDTTRFDGDKLRTWKHNAEAKALESIGRAEAVAHTSEPTRKVQAISPWIGAQITLARMNTGKAAVLLGPVRGTSAVTLIGCNEHFATVSIGDTPRSIPLNCLQISFDHGAGRLELQESHA